MNHSQIAIWTWKPEPGRAASTGWKPGHVGDRDERHEDGRDLDDEHDRVLDQQARVELAERLREGRPEQLRVEDAARPRRLAPDGLGAAEGHEALEAARAAPKVDGR